ncbi:MAG: TadE/TadG family type IV pilus assembly protein [Lentisphaeria bacterium]|jgi:Flp pilus assembly protein TadG
MKRPTDNGKRGLARDAGGSVLLETVIAIPLFIVLIGGTFWLGELILAKQKLVGADRFAAWRAGNRHASGGAGSAKGVLQQQLFPEERVGRQRIARVTVEN